VRKSAEEIEERFFEIWRRITLTMCGNYCANYERRLLAVIEANGGYTKYNKDFCSVFVVTKSASA
jgi:hypothetical protein